MRRRHWCPEDRCLYAGRLCGHELLLGLACLQFQHHLLETLTDQGVRLLCQLVGRLDLPLLCKPSALVHKSGDRLLEIVPVVLLLLGCLRLLLPPALCG